MAGNYPDAPSWRMPIDRDGTVGLTLTSSNMVATQFTHDQMVVINNESNDSINLNLAISDSCVFVFPEARDIDGYYISISTSPYSFQYSVSVSPDSTNGVDGTWSTIGTGSSSSAFAYRTGIVSVTSLAMRAIKITITGGSYTVSNLAAFHLYGEVAPGQNPNRLALWHPTLDERVTPAFFDWGNVPRNSSGDRVFRVKNMSASLTASSIRVAMEALTDTTPSVPAQHSLSYGGGSFLAQVNVGDLAPGAISGPVTLRRITPSNATLGLWSMRVFADANSWS